MSLTLRTTSSVRFDHPPWLMITTKEFAYFKRLIATQWRLVHRSGFNPNAQWLFVKTQIDTGDN